MGEEEERVTEDPACFPPSAPDSFPFELQRLSALLLPDTGPTS